MLEIIKKNKYTVLFIVLFIVLVIVGYQAYSILVPNENRAVYGDRLDGIDAVMITSDQMTSINNEIKTNTFVTDCVSDLKGKILYVTVTVTDDTSVDSIRSFPDVVLSKLDDAQKAYFDVQVIFTKPYTELLPQLEAAQKKVDDLEDQLASATAEEKTSVQASLDAANSELQAIEDQMSFPLIAYKNAKSETFSWTKDRGNGQ